jgi:hypothetical protein
MEASYRLGKILSDMSRDGSAFRETWTQDPEAYDRTTESDLETPQIRQGDEPAQVMALLHWRLMDDHTTILQSRSFFLSLVLQTPTRAEEAASNGVKKRTIRGALTPCVRAAAKSIVLAMNAHDVGMLPSRNPFLTYVNLHPDVQKGT